jgi:hypothetical protein
MTGYDRWKLASPDEGEDEEEIAARESQADLQCDIERDDRLTEGED